MMMTRPRTKPSHDNFATQSLGDPVDRHARLKRNGHGSAVVWLTGLSGSGKSTVAKSIEAALFDLGVHVYVLDGDELRRGLCRDLQFSQADRSENLRRAAEVARILADAGLVVIASFISPYGRDRQAARGVVGEMPFIEVFVDCPLAECIRRDPKGLYARARAGEIPEFTGVSAPYEPPEHPEVHLRTERLSVGESVALVVGHLKERGVLP
jgi:adenylyl-sulfate kinase